MNEGVPIDNVLEVLTGRQPDPIEIKDPEFRRLRDLEGKARRANRITDEKEWLKQLEQFHNGDAI